MHSDLLAAQGVWKPQLIANPAYYKDETPLANIGKIDAVAIEIWTMDSGFYFDDIVVANDPSLAAEFRDKTYGPKKATEVQTGGLVCPFRRMVSLTTICPRNNGACSALPDGGFKPLPGQGKSRPIACCQSGRLVSSGRRVLSQSLDASPRMPSTYSPDTLDLTCVPIRCMC